MKTLFIVAEAPYPPRSGAPLRAWQNINIVATRGPVSVFSVGGREPGDYDMPGVAEWVHIDNADFPSRRGLRALFARIFMARQYTVPDVLATRTINERLRSMIKRIRPDLIVLSHWKDSYPAPLKRHANVVLDMHNVESFLGTGVTHIKPAIRRELRLWRWRRSERRLVRRAAVTWVCGPNDVMALKRLDPRLPAPIVWPNAIDVEQYSAIHGTDAGLPDGLRRNGATILYVGLYRYRPNQAAAVELIENIFPLISERLPDARLVLVGDAPSPAMKAAAEKDSRIIVTGQVSDVRPYLSLADVCIVPLRTGGGTRLKILECFAARVPVVTTTKGVEGIDATPGREVCVAESAEDLAQCALALLENRDKLRRQVELAFELVRRSYSWSALTARLDGALPAMARRARP